MIILAKYNQSKTVMFPLVTRGAVDFKTGATFAAGDVKISKDGGAFANTTNLPTELGSGWYQLVLTATETQAARISISVIDQDATKVFEDQAVYVETYGNASAEHEIDLDQPNVKVNSAFKKNTAYTSYMFLMVDDTDGKTPETGLTGISCTRSIDGGAFGACANAASEVGSGWYKIDLATTDLNGDEIVLRFTKAGVARNWEHKIRTNAT